MLTKPQFSDLEAFWVMTLSESVQPRGKCANLYNQLNLVEKQFSQFTIICQSLCWNNQNHLQLVTRAIRSFFSFRDFFYTSEVRILSTSGLQRLRLSRCIFHGSLVSGVHTLKSQWEPWSSAVGRPLQDLSWQVEQVCCSGTYHSASSHKPMVEKQKPKTKQDWR